MPACRSGPAGARGLLLVGNHLSATAGTRAVGEDLAVRLGELGWRVTATSRQPHRLLRLGDMLWTAYRKRSAYDAAIVDVFSGKAFLWAECVCWLLGRMRKPFVLVLHGGGLPDFAARFPQRVERLLRRATAVVTPSRFLGERLQHLRADIRRIANGIDLKRYPFRLRSSPSPSTCWLRAFHSIYSPLLAIEAFAGVASAFPDACLTMIGPDKGDGSMQAVRRRAEGLGIASRVRIAGLLPNSEVPQWLNRSDIFINTTNYESFGVAVVEAAACGLCIVSTRVGEIPLLWSDGGDALLVPPRDPLAMTHAMHRVLAEPGLAERLSRNARAKAEQFDWPAILPEWERLLAEVAQARQ